MCVCVCVCVCVSVPTLGVSAVQDGESDRAVHLVLAGDDGGIQQALLSSRVESIGQRDCRTQLLRLHRQTQFPDTCRHQ